MIKLETRLETKQVEVIVSRKCHCDRCRKEIVQPNGYETDKRKIEFSHSEDYPEFSRREEDHAYLCEDCGDFVRDLLEKNGVKFEHEELDIR